MLFDGGRGESQLQGLDVRGDMDRFDVLEVGQAVELAPGGKALDGVKIRFARVWVSDGGGEEFDEAARGVFVGREKDWQCRGGLDQIRGHFFAPCND